jgi:hypothetical protein
VQTISWSKQFTRNNEKNFIKYGISYNDKAAIKPAPAMNNAAGK